MSRPAVTAPRGLAGDPLSVQRERVLAAWDGFLAAAASADGPSRLPGWSAHDVAVHIGDWSGPTALDRLLTQARSGSVAPPVDTDALNAAVVAAHRSASRDDVLAALARSRQSVSDWLSSDEPAALGQVTVMSVVGPLPLFTVLNAGAYELAVHALDLDATPTPALLDAGLAALVDVTGVFAHRRGLPTSLTAWTGHRGWQVRTDALGWRTSPVAARPSGAVVEGPAEVVLDASAGRRAVPPLLASRALKVHGLPDILRLAPIVDEVPGLPGGPALKAAARWVGTTGRLLRFTR